MQGMSAESCVAKMIIMVMILVVIMMMIMIMMIMMIIIEMMIMIIMMIMKIILDDSGHLAILARLNPEPAIPPSF